MALPNVGAWVGNRLGFDPTPGFQIQKPKIGSGGINIIGKDNGGPATRSMAAPSTPAAKSPSSNPTRTTTTTPKAVADPYAKFGGTAAYNSLRAGFGDQKNVTIGTADRAAATSAGQRRNSILDFLDGLRQQEKSIDNAGIVAERSRLQGLDDVESSVQGGVRNANSLLAGRNAGGATVGTEIAKYLQGQGRQQASRVNNDYDIAQLDIANQQEALDVGRNSQLRGFEQDKQASINNIVDAAELGLAEINSAMANASLPDRISLQEEKNAILNRVTSQLSQFDQMLNQGASSVRSRGVDDRRAEAARQRDLGVGAYDDTAYDFETAQATPNNTQTDLPLFTYSFRRRGV